MQTITGSFCGMTVFFFCNYHPPLMQVCASHVGDEDDGGAGRAGGVCRRDI